jgi:hypothetical protein
MRERNIVMRVSGPPCTLNNEEALETYQETLRADPANAVLRARIDEMKSK